jgi:hypothetical protein
MNTLDKDIKILTPSDQDRKDVLEKASKLGYTLISGDSLNAKTIERLCAMKFTDLTLRTDRHPIHTNMLLGSFIQLGYNINLFKMAVMIEEMTLNDFKSL